MTVYEYIRVQVDAGDLSKLNALASTGWRVVGLFHHEARDGGERYEQWYALLERPTISV